MSEVDTPENGGTLGTRMRADAKAAEETAMQAYVEQFTAFKKICRTTDPHLTQHECVILFRGYLPGGDA